MTPARSRFLGNYSFSVKSALPVFGGGLLFMLLGFVVFVPTVDSLFEAQGKEVGATLPKTIANAIVEIVATRQDAAVSAAIEDVAADKHVAYVVVRDSSGDVLAAAGALSGEIKQQLVKLPALETGAQSFFLEGTEILDVNAPILEGALGVVNVGFNRTEQRSGLSSLNRKLSLMLVAAVALATLGGIVFGRYLIAPLQDLIVAANRIVEEGDLGQEIIVQTGDEIGQLAERFRKLVEKLRTIPVTLTASVGDLTKAVEAVEQMVRVQDSIVQRQGSGLAEATATMQEIKQTSAVAAAKAEAVGATAQKAEAVGTAGQDALEASLAGVQEIRTGVHNIASRITDLAERAAQVGEIIETVKDLADQSNILALNAAIEATKAGEFGRGFGVVAREIRTLADQSIQATGRVREILNEIQQAVRATVTSTDEGRTRIDQAMTEINASGENLRELTAIVLESSQAARQIVASVSQQNVGITQITAAVVSLSGAMEDALQGVKAAQQVVDNLRVVSTQVTGVVSSFKT